MYILIFKLVCDRCLCSYGNTFMIYFILIHIFLYVYCIGIGFIVG